MDFFLDKILIKDLVARGIIGIDSWERSTTQEILINIVIYTDLKTAGQTDRIEDTTSYSQVAQKIVRHAETARRFTVEALAADIAWLCLEETSINRVDVRVEKPGAVRFASSVGVEITRTREDFSTRQAQISEKDSGTILSDLANRLDKP
jgi:FolB domain-containing protein